MKKYVCSICGYVYDEAIGIAEQGIAPGTKWGDLPEQWVCPLCGAVKAEFDLQEARTQTSQEINEADQEDVKELRELSFAELSAVCSNLSKGCEKQYLEEESNLFKKLAQYYQSKVVLEKEVHFNDLIQKVQQDLKNGYIKGNQVASKVGDRGALRALVWGEKVSKILSSLLRRYEKDPEGLLASTNVYVCEICGFIYVGDEAPEICPVCKVPKMKLTQVQRR